MLDFKICEPDASNGKITASEIITSYGSGTQRCRCFCFWFIIALEYRYCSIRSLFYNHLSTRSTHLMARFSSRELGFVVTWFNKGQGWLQVYNPEVKHSVGCLDKPKPAKSIFGQSNKYWLVLVSRLINMGALHQFWPCLLTRPFNFPNHPP